MKIGTYSSIWIPENKKGFFKSQQLHQKICHSTAQFDKRCYDRRFGKLKYISNRLSCKSTCGYAYLILVFRPNQTIVENLHFVMLWKKGYACVKLVSTSQKIIRADI